MSLIISIYLYFKYVENDETVSSFLFQTVAKVQKL